MHRRLESTKSGMGGEWLPFRGSAILNKRKMQVTCHVTVQSQNGLLFSLHTVSQVIHFNFRYKKLGQQFKN